MYKPKLYRLLYLPLAEYIKVPYFIWDGPNGNANTPYILEEHHIKNILHSILGCYINPKMFTTGITQKLIEHNGLLKPILKEHFVIEEVINEDS